MNMVPHSLPDETYDRRRSGSDQMRHWGILLLLIGSVWLVFEATGRGAFLWNNLGFVEQTHQVVEVWPGQNLDIDVVGDHVTLETWDQPQIRIEATRHAFGWSSADAEHALEDMAMQIRQAEGTIYVDTTEHAWFRFRRAPYIRFRIALPEQADFTVHSINGDIQVSDVRGDGMLETVNGNITLEDTHGSLIIQTTNGQLVIDDHQGRLDLTTTNGDVQISGSQNETITARSMNADMLFDGSTGVLKASTVSGDVTIVNAHDTQLDIESVRGNLDISASLAPTVSQRLRSRSGDIALQISHPGDFQLSANTLSGTLENTLDLDQIEQTARSLSGILGEGNTSLSIMTDSGDIRLSAQ